MDDLLVGRRNWADAGPGLQTAINYADEQRKTTTTGGSSNPSGGAWPVLIPPGLYRVDTPINVPDYAQIIGLGAVLYTTDSSVDFLTSVGYQATISGLRFRGGNRHIVIDTNNVNSIVVNIDDCHHDTPATAGIDITNSASTLVNITRGRAIGLGSARYLRMDSGDKVVVRDCWVEDADSYAFEVSGGMLEAEGLLCVPSARDDAWFWLKDNGQLQARHLRLGGEGGGKPAVRCETGPDTSNPIVPTRLVMRDSQCFSTNYAFEFYDLPNIVEITGCHGWPNSDGVYFDSEIPAASKDIANRHRTIGPSVVALSATGDQASIDSFTSIG